MAKQNSATTDSKFQGAPSNELRQRLLFVLFALVIYRFGSYVPVPGIDPTALAQLFDSQRDTILGLFNMFSGGALGRFSVFAINVMPYISASIIMQMLSHVEPRLKEIRKEGEAGRRKITKWTRYGTVALATFQALGISIALEQQSGLVLDPGLSFRITTVATLVTGTMFLVWLGEQVSERGIGNGISIIIFAGIVAGLPSAFGGTLEKTQTGELNILLVLLVFTIVALVTAFVVFVERGQRRITVQYAKRQLGRRVYAGQSSHLPLKLNMAGVIPPIFASSIILFPTSILGWFGSDGGSSWVNDLTTYLSPGQPIYTIAFGGMIMFFCFFYTALVFDPNDTADNLRRQGAFIPGVRPGAQSARYIDNIMTRLTVWGAIYITAVCLLPEIMNTQLQVPFYFGGTSLLIVVVVTMDFMAQVQAHSLPQQYSNVLRKANLKGYKRGGGLPR